MLLRGTIVPISLCCLMRRKALDNGTMHWETNTVPASDELRESDNGGNKEASAASSNAILDIHSEN